MLTESSSKTSLWGGLSAGAKTAAMGTAGVALWGSLAFYFLVGGEEAQVADTLEPSERLFLRMELPETVLLDGCVENFGGSACADKGWIIISENKERARSTMMPRGLTEAMPAPLWTEVVARHSMSDADCKATLEKELPEWLGSGSRARPGLHATLVPDRFTACQARASGIDPVIDAQAFWIMKDHKIVAELRCSLPVEDRSADCQLSAFPDHGDYVVSYSRLPAANVSSIVDQTGHMMGVLSSNMPEGMQDRVDLSFLDGKIAFDEASAHALSSLGNMVR